MFHAGSPWRNQLPPRLTSVSSGDGKSSRTPCCRAVVLWRRSPSGAVQLLPLVETALDVARAMAHLHKHNIVHSDLKARNVLLRSDAHDPRGFTAKVADFGLSLTIDPNATHVSNAFQVGRAGREGVGGAAVLVLGICLAGRCLNSCRLVVVKSSHQTDLELQGPLVWSSSRVWRCG